MQLNAADETTDMKALAQLAISCLADAEAEASAAIEQVTELGAKLHIQEETKELPGIAVTVKGETKMLIGKKFKIKKVEYTAQQVADDQELVDYLASIKSGSLVDMAALKQPEEA